MPNRAQGRIVIYFPNCTAHKNRMQGNDFVHSVMYRHGITCSSCHDAHGTSNYAQLRKPANRICLDCHGPTSAYGPRTATLEQMHHKDGSPGSVCVACHMPAIETEAVPGTFVHAHTFRFVSPAMTDKYGIPNPCTSCNQDKPTGWPRMLSVTCLSNLPGASDSECDERVSAAFPLDSELVWPTIAEKSYARSCGRRRLASALFYAWQLWS